MKLSKAYGHSRSTVTVKYDTTLSDDIVRADIEQGQLSAAYYQVTEATVRTTTVEKFKLERPMVETYRNEIFGQDGK